MTKSFEILGRSPNCRQACPQLSLTTTLPSRLSVNQIIICVDSKSAPTSKMSDAESVDSENEARVFTLKCKAMLLTYYLLNMPLQTFISKIIDRLEGKSWTANKEICPSTIDDDEPTTHYHVYIHSRKQMEHLLTFWNVDGVQPDCSQNKITGSGFATARDRGHFYVECRHKIGHETQDSNYPVFTCYAVKQVWIMALWQRKKILTSNVIECCNYYLCNTQRAIQIINLALQYERTVRRDRQCALIATPHKYPFKVYTQILDFKLQFVMKQDRYKFLIVTGPTNLGKTKLVKHNFPGAYSHDSVIDWSGYDPTIHTAVIFDDVPNWPDYILENKTLFQSNHGSYTVQGSATNCYSMKVDLRHIPLIICTNDMCWDTYIEPNSLYIDVTLPTWVVPP